MAPCCGSAGVALPSGPCPAKSALLEQGAHHRDSCALLPGADRSHTRRSGASRDPRLSLAVPGGRRITAG
ncbi:hypothetical protein APASM_6030 [Actinosynnema pretiosum subsp. pretiosum]|nr:hypothetical protein APASM_6030 [Actinosynnema pretiosum subsp. pretiosum]